MSISISDRGCSFSISTPTRLPLCSNARVADLGENGRLIYGITQSQQFRMLLVLEKPNLLYLSVLNPNTFLKSIGDSLSSELLLENLTSLKHLVKTAIISRFCGDIQGRVLEIALDSSVKKLPNESIQSLSTLLENSFATSRNFELVSRIGADSLPHIIIEDSKLSNAIFQNAIGMRIKYRNLFPNTPCEFEIHQLSRTEKYMLTIRSPQADCSQLSQQARNTLLFSSSRENKSDNRLVGTCQISACPESWELILNLTLQDPNSYCHLDTKQIFGEIARQLCELKINHYRTNQ